MIEKLIAKVLERDYKIITYLRINIKILLKAQTNLDQYQIIAKCNNFSTIFKIISFKKRKKTIQIIIII